MPMLDRVRAVTQVASTIAALKLALAAMARLRDTHGMIKRGRHWYRLFAQVRSVGGTVPAALS
ncbi:hypothetical protein SAMN05216276_100227 [Streptosporangium subroseum]|uniref:Uncharacterized protein n=1 Tax=Streptosporangium subroseum TaxID=106412 RepID=A0A239AMT8_9ACTN|nr:hypothetical protein SAMN05216276_100227 [Streptosporangium subroseum]